MWILRIVYSKTVSGQSSHLIPVSPVPRNVTPQIVVQHRYLMTVATLVLRTLTEIFKYSWLYIPPSLRASSSCEHLRSCAAAKFDHILCIHSIFSIYLCNRSPQISCLAPILATIPALVLRGMSPRMVSINTCASSLCGYPESYLTANIFHSPCTWSIQLPSLPSMNYHLSQSLNWTNFVHISEKRKIWSWSIVICLKYEIHFSQLKSELPTPYYSHIFNDNQTVACNHCNWLQQYVPFPIKELRADIIFVEHFTHSKFWKISLNKTCKLQHFGNFFFFGILAFGILAFVAFCIWHPKPYQANDQTKRFQLSDA